MEDMNLFQQLWQNWADRPYVQEDFANEMTWINELNQAVFTRLEKRLPAHIQLRVAKYPVCSYGVKSESPIDPVWNPDGIDRQNAVMDSHRVVVPEGPFEDRVELAVELLLELIDRPGTRTAFLYWPLVPESAELHDGTPNRKYLKTRLATTPNVAVDAREGNT